MTNRISSFGQSDYFAPVGLTDIPLLEPVQVLLQCCGISCTLYLAVQETVVKNRRAVELAFFSGLFMYKIAWGLKQYPVGHRT